jgi:hypothetical protein
MKIEPDAVAADHVAQLETTSWPLFHQLVGGSSDRLDRTNTRRTIEHDE